MDKFSVEELIELWGIWEEEAGESFIDYFVDDNIKCMPFVLGYWSAKFPDLFEFLMNIGEGKIPWSSAQDAPIGFESISCLVEIFYKVVSCGVEEDGHWSQETYNKSIMPWCSLIHDIDIYYNRFIKWKSKQQILCKES